MDFGTLSSESMKARTSFTFAPFATAFAMISSRIASNFLRPASVDPVWFAIASADARAELICWIKDDRFASPASVISSRDPLLRFICSPPDSNAWLKAFCDSATPSALPLSSSSLPLRMPAALPSNCICTVAAAAFSVTFAWASFAAWSAVVVVPSRCASCCRALCWAIVASVATFVAAACSSCPACLLYTSPSPRDS